MSDNVVRAEEILGNNAFTKEDAATAGAAAVADEHEDVEYDLGRLLAVDIHPLDGKRLRKEGEKYLKETATAGAQKLIAQIFNLPVEMTEHGPAVTLPDPTTALPRWKPAPKPRPETRWEKYAQEKNIKKRKKDTKVFDEGTGEWKPAFGYGVSVLLRLIPDTYSFVVWLAAAGSPGACRGPMMTPRTGRSQ